MNKSALIILDGWGLAKNPSVSAIERAKTPFMDSLLGAFPNSQLEASGIHVGLPDGQMGNSEVGHMNLGAGRVIQQDLARISLLVDEGALKSLPAMQQLITSVKQGKRLHLIGLVSDGGVHSHINHFKGILSHCRQEGLTDVQVHAFMDGRDCDPHSGAAFLAELQAHMDKHVGQIATVMGRYHAMDRDHRWERIGKAYDAMIHGKGDVVSQATSASSALREAYAKGQSDEFIEPMVLNPQGMIQPGDALLFVNFRSDRARQLTKVLSQSAEAELKPLDLDFYTMTRYDDSFEGLTVLFDKDKVQDCMGQVLADAGLRQIRIAETEKYPHVTYFFNGGHEAEFEGEQRILIPSPKVATYDLQPEMSAYEIRDAIIPLLTDDGPDFICLNFANPDMVGHTGNMDAAVQAVETVDACAEAVVQAGLSNGYTFFILADHGNCDCMINPDGSPNTAHSTQPVPFHLVSALDCSSINMGDGALSDVAPTILEWMGVTQPEQMTGQSLIQHF